ncbi:MAG: M23 family metallopeptidase [Pseudomonadota bacterium]|nr:M23 family metallopeptidase [Pseudomonadota bacterium]
MKNNYNVIIFFSNNYKVITSFLCNYKVYPFLLCNNKVITKIKSNYKIITKYLIYYIVITFSLPAFALSFDTDLREGRLIFGHLEPDETLFVEEFYLNIGKNTKNLFKIPTNSDNRFVFGIPQDATQITLTLKKANTLQKKSFPIKKYPWDEEYVTGLPPAKVSPNPKNQARITSESLEMRQARQISVFPSFPEKWTLPVPQYTRISSHFGSRRILNNIKKQGHSGTDLAAPIGTPVLSPATGKVVYIHPDMFLTGKTVLIDHGFGVFSSYSHLNSIEVQLNQEVKSGDLIGTVGQTGRATGPHLHFTVTWYGVRVNPEDLIFKN